MKLLLQHAKYHMNKTPPYFLYKLYSHVLEMFNFACISTASSLA